MNAEDHAQVALDFLEAGAREMREGDELQGSEKFWGAASHAIMAYLAYEGRPTPISHKQFRETAQRLTTELANPNIALWFRDAERLHSNFYHNLIDDEDLRDESCRGVSSLVELLVSGTTCTDNLAASAGSLMTLPQQVEWTKCGPAFCNLETVNLQDVKGLGVYVIWQSPSRQVVYVGQGEIAGRLSAHRNDASILLHRGNGSLLVTWTYEPDEDIRLGIERYLAELWSPLRGFLYSREADPVPVNLPA